jgi:hypothetical protein
MAAARLIWAIDPVTIKTPGLNARDSYMPHIASAIICGVKVYLRFRRFVPGILEELETNTRSMAAE